jgi:hypothetical protein
MLYMAECFISMHCVLFYALSRSSILPVYSRTWTYLSKFQTSLCFMLVSLSRILLVTENLVLRGADYLYDVLLHWNRFHCLCITLLALSTFNHILHYLSFCWFYLRHLSREYFMYFDYALSICCRFFSSVLSLFKRCC